MKPAPAMEERAMPETPAPKNLGQKTEAILLYAVRQDER
jgi:hypothetical protein